MESDGGFMKKGKNNFFSAKNLAYFAVLAALIVVLQVFSGSIKIGSTPMSFVLVPIVLGGIILGPVAGGLLGGIFGLIVIVDALCGLDAFTLYLLNTTPVFTVLLCLLKGIAAGVVSSLVYRLIAKKNKYVAIFVAAALAPICNTGIFAIGAFFIMDPILALLGDAYAGLSAGYIVFIVLIGVNFFVEFAINLLCAPALYTVNNVVEKQIKISKKVKNDNLS
jgi:uncharacterized membrane protein